MEKYDFGKRRQIKRIEKTHVHGKGERIERNAQGWNNERILIMISWDVAHEPK